MMKNLLPILSIFFILGCEDKKEDTILEADALLRWTGDYAVDGCGFFIDIGENEYKPEDELAIPDSLKIDTGVDVFIKYELLDEPIEFTCGFQHQEIDGLKLNSIEKR